MNDVTATQVPADVIARICHEANKAWCEANGDTSQLSWHEAAQWQRDSAIMGVKFALDNPYATPGAQHEAWMADKLADGWMHGEVKDAALKTHPALLPYDQLPLVQQVKDRIFTAIVHAIVERPPYSDRDHGPATRGQEAPPVDNAHVAIGCEQFADQGADAAGSVIVFRTPFEPELPAFKSHKLVRADRIVSVMEGDTHVTLVLAAGTKVEQTTTWYQRMVAAMSGKPISGSYFVAYRDGYCSISPPLEFEDGYTPIDG